MYFFEKGRKRKCISNLIYLCNFGKTFSSTNRNFLYTFTIYAACFEKAIESFGTLDIVINNAGIMNDAEWEPMVDVNYVSNEGSICYSYRRFAVFGCFYHIFAYKHIYIYIYIFFFFIRKELYVARYWA